jgi:hypothetical protein
MTAGYNKKSDKSPTAWTKRPLSEASGSSRAKKAAKLINAKVSLFLLILDKTMSALYTNNVMLM